MKRGEKKIKKIYIIIGIAVVILIIGWIFVRFVVGGDEDSWIKDSRGVYVKHGNPSEIPGVVTWQEAVIACAADKFANFTGIINSQCLGICGNYAVDIVHVPRIPEDDLTENKCSDYGNGFVNHFIELDKNGDIVRIV
jgi:hypothetical protein